MVQMSTKKIKVFVAEDEFYVLDSLRIFLTQDTRTIFAGGSQNTADALSVLESSPLGERADIVLVDLKFRDKEGKEETSGLDLIRRLDSLRKEGNFKGRIICLSMSLDPQMIISAVAAGADGYLDKNQAAEGIVDAVVAASKGQFVASPNIAERILNKLENPSAVYLLPDKGRSDLGKRIEEVAFLYYRSGLTAKEIAAELFIAESTVRSHIKRIKEILQVTSRSEAITKLTGRINPTDDNGLDH